MLSEKQSKCKDESADTHVASTERERSKRISETEANACSVFFSSKIKDTITREGTCADQRTQVQLPVGLKDFGRNDLSQQYNGTWHIHTLTTRKDRFSIQYTMFSLLNENCTRGCSLEKKRKK